MKTTLAIPDPIFRRVKATAALEGKSLKAFLMQAVMHEIEQHEKAAGKRTRIQIPLVASKRPGSLSLTGEAVADVLDAEDIRALAPGDGVAQTHPWPRVLTQGMERRLPGSAGRNGRPESGDL